MDHDTQAERQPAAVAIALAAVLGALLAALSVTPREDAGATALRGPVCSAAGEAASEVSRRQLRRSVRCLFNEQRALRELGELARDPRLQKAAQRHSKAMAATECLAHRCPGEAGLDERVRKAGYLAGAKRWGYAESTGCAPDAEAMVKSWIETDFHRVNILGHKFTELGVGVVGDRVKGRCPGGYATFAVVLGLAHADRIAPLGSSTSPGPRRPGFACRAQAPAPARRPINRWRFGDCIRLRCSRSPRWRRR